jgi:restriction system protein
MALFGSRNNTQRIDTPTTLDGVKAMAWRDFEKLIGEAFRKRGYAVEETGHGGLDGDIDLILRKGGRTELVQCKQWKTRQIHVATIRELWGLVAHHKADALKVVSAGAFAADADAFTKGKAIELIDGGHLLELIRGVDVAPPNGKPDASPTEDIRQPSGSSNPTTPLCPRCGGAMYQRFNLQTSKMYWGCVQYPGCKGAQPL